MKNLESYIPAGLPAHRALVLCTALAEVGTREATGHNDGEVLKYVPEWARGKGYPYCAWFAGWCFIQALGEHPYGRHLGAVWDLFRAGQAAGEALLLNAAWPALGPQPGDIFIIFHSDDWKKKPVPGHAGLILRVDQDGSKVNTVEGNFHNRVGVATRLVSDFAGVLNPYGRIADEHSSVSWDRGLIEAPPAGGLEHTR